jgi:hypothetical protein
MSLKNNSTENIEENTFTEIEEPLSKEANTLAEELDTLAEEVDTLTKKEADTLTEEADTLTKKEADTLTEEADTLTEEADTIINLQLGDIIHIIDPLNEKLNDQMFSIDYIDKSKMYLINTDTLDKIRLSINEDGVLGDGNITRIAIRKRLDTPSYARQNGLIPGKWINIYFGGDFPIIITGEITNLEKDMIEIKTIDGDVIYINFEFKGIPEDLPIELIEIREKPSIKETELEGELEGLEELEGEEGEEKMTKLDISIPVKNVKDQLREFIIKADQIHFGSEELGPIVQYVDVSSKSQRYSLETQLSDLLDELLSTVPSSQRTPRVLNNIHIMIDRFKQLRQNFSFFDNYGNIEGILLREANYKPLIEYFNSFKTNLFWILPVVKNIKKIYDVENIDEENSDFVDLSIETNLKNMNELIQNYKSNALPIEQNKYSGLYSELNPYFTPFELIGDENKQEIISEKLVNQNINTIIDNLENMYSTIFTNGNIRDRRFVIQKYNLSLSKLDSIDTNGAKFVTVRTNINNNDLMSIKSFLTLPEPTIRFSKINLPGTSILDRANLNLLFINYWELLKKKTIINTVFIDDLNTELEFNEMNFVNSIKNYVLNLNEDQQKELKKDEIYSKLINMIIPKTKILFELMKKYINGKLSIIEVVSYLEPFLVYTDDLTYKQYTEIVKFIDEKISQYNKSFIDKSRLFNILSGLKSDSIISTKAFTIIEIVNKRLQNTVFTEGYDLNEPEKTFTNSEILRKLTIKDYLKLYTTAISLQNIPLMFPSEFSVLFEEEKEKLDKKTNNFDEEKCKPTVIAKYYDSIDDLKADDDRLIYFDKKYDKTNYGLLESKDGYEKQVMTMSIEELRIYIMKDLIEKKRMTELDAEYLADTLVDGHKEVIDGQYAILYKGYNEKKSKEIDFYIRKDNTWILDTELNKLDVNTDESTILCDLQKQCINVPGKIQDSCENIKENEFGLQTKLLKDVINEFDNKYKISKEEFEQKIQSKFDYYISLIAILSKIEINQMLKYNNIKYKLATKVEEQSNPKPISPYLKLLNLILRYPEFSQKQNYIIKFVNSYTRPAIDQTIGPLGEFENEHWLYCIKTSIPLLPTFLFNLATTFIIEGDYGYKNYIEIVKSKIGKLSDDGDWWCDKFSGWTICQVDFDVEEGYEEGFKASSRAIMEEEAGNKILSTLSGKSIKYDTPDTRMINNIINTLSIAMGINIEIQKEFIINVVLSAIKDSVETENDYKKKIKEMAEKGKKSISYTDFYNTALLYYTFGMYLIAIQTSIPSVKTRKTHPGCVRSFSGYPFEGAGDLSSLTYLGCIVYDIKVSSEPWNILKAKKQDAIINKIKNSIDYLLPYPDVKRKIEEKTEYLLTSDSLEIPEEYSITNWFQFLPPLVNFKVKHLVNITEEFKRSLLSDIRSGSTNQRDKLLVINSKMIQFSLAIIEKIQDVVKKQKLLLLTGNNDPYLENACCETNELETTFEYFTNRESKIIEYNDTVTRLSNMMEDIISYAKGGLFYSDINTKNHYPSIKNEFSEETIYLVFIFYCKFKSLIPIPVDLLPLCTSKPDNGIINSYDSIDRIIEKLKNDGRNYTNENVLRLLQIISKNNIVNIDINKKNISPIRKLSELLDSIIDENDEVVERSLIDLLYIIIDSYDVVTEEQSKEVRDLNNYLIRNIESMKEEIIDFVGKNYGANITKSSVKKMKKTIDNLSNWMIDESDRKQDDNISNYKTYNINHFFKNFIDNFVNIFPNIILNEVDYDDTHIPNYYGFSRNHNSKLKKYISEYYEKLKKFYGLNTLSNILTTVQKSCKNIILLANNTPSYSTIKVDDIELKTIFDERTSRFLFEYYLLRVLIHYIELSDLDVMIVTEVRKEVEVTDLFSSEYIEEQETQIDLGMSSRSELDVQLLRGNKKELKQKTAEILIAFIDILNNQKDTINTSYEEIQDRVFKLREKEKDIVTDRLKVMTDEERNADTILKINKLGMYSKGMQKGLTTLDKDFYDEEQDFRDNMSKAERIIRKTNTGINDENLDLYLEDFIEQQQIDKEIDDDVYDMSYMGESYFDGNTDGVGGPEEEYEDFEEEY